MVTGNDLQDGDSRATRLDMALRLGLAALAGVLLWYLFCLHGNTEDVAARGRSAIRWMVERWNGAGGDLSHGWLIPIVSGFVIWRMRAALLTEVRRPSLAGIVFVASAIVLHLVGMRIQQTRLSLVALVALSWSIPLLLWGWGVARRLVFPCAYLLFCIPYSFIDNITLPLRLVATGLGAGILNGCGVMVDSVGTSIYFPNMGVALDVADPCSGLRYLLAMLALTAAYGYFQLTSNWQRWILFACAVPLAVIGNVARILVIAIIAGLWGQNTAMGVYHTYSGYIVFAVAILLMLAVSRLLARIWKAADAAPGTATDKAGAVWVGRGPPAPPSG